MRLLKSTERTVLSVAFECGFDDLSTFYRAFKRETGVSPNHWREETPERN
jgi:AraC-like DNA-binding protein